MMMAQLATDSKAKIDGLRSQITAARTHLHEVSASRSELENLRETYSRGRDDYAEVVSRMQSEIDHYDADLLDCSQRIGNRDSLIGAYRKQIAAAEAQIREIESGGTIHIQVPVIKKSTEMPSIQPANKLTVEKTRIMPATGPATKSGENIAD